MKTRLKKPFVNDRFISLSCVVDCFKLCFFSESPPSPKMSSLDMFEESPALEAGSSSEAAGSPPEVEEEAVGSVLTDRTNTIHRDQVRFYILCPSRKPRLPAAVPHVSCSDAVPVGTLFETFIIKGLVALATLLIYLVFQFQTYGTVY
jgi:hypothetical protein